MTARYAPTGLSRQRFPLGEVRETVLNQPSEEVKRLPFYNLLPNNWTDLLRWRIYVRQRAHRDLEFRENINEMCRRDICFFANTLCWVFEPRPPIGPRKLPLMLWCDQADVLTWLDECFGERDIGVEKTRGIGLTWTDSVKNYHKWLYVPDSKIAMSTKDEATMDGPDSNFLIGKIVFLHENMPWWLRYGPTGNRMKRTIQDHTLVNTVNGSVLTGFAPTDEKLRSLRFTNADFDEFAFYPRRASESLNSSSGTTNARTFVSTWHGHDNAHDLMMHGPPTTMLRVFTYWWNNPERWRGAYRMNKGKVELIDKEYVHPPDYEFGKPDVPGLTDVMRSPWVDTELSRFSGDIQTAVEELYGITAEKTSKFFRSHIVQVVEATAMLPLREGIVTDGLDERQFIDEVDGPVKLWHHVGDGIAGPFGAGCDIGFGRSNSYSALEIVDLPTGKQILEFATNDQDIEQFAKSVVTILEWLVGDKGHGHCYLTYEANGPAGGTFGDQLIKNDYSNIQRSEKKDHWRSNRPQQYLGVANRDKGLRTLTELGRVVTTGDIIVSSPWVLYDMQQFDKDDDGRPLFPNNADGHGDRAQALALAWDYGRHFRPGSDMQFNPVTKEIQRRAKTIHGIMIETVPNWPDDESGTTSWGDGWGFGTPHKPDPYIGFRNR